MAWSIVDVANLEDVGSDAPGSGPRPWGRFTAGAVVVLLLVGGTVTSLQWNSAHGRAERLAATLAGTRADLAERSSEASNLRLEVSNLQADKNVLNRFVAELQSEKTNLQIDNEDLTAVNEEINVVVRLLDQCLADMRDLGGKLLRDPQAVPDERIRRAATQCAAAQAAAAVLKATTTPAQENAV